jgi:hypothetical protein
MPQPTIGRIRCPIDAGMIMPRDRMIVIAARGRKTIDTVSTDITRAVRLALVASGLRAIAAGAAPC